MEKLSMCRVCLAEGVRMQPIANTPLQEVYESLNMTPLETKDIRPVQVCYMCSASLRNCYLLRLSCRRSEDLFTRMMNTSTLQLAQRQETSSISRLQVTSVIHLSVGEQPLECRAGDVKCEPPDVLDDMVKREDAETDDVENCSPKVSDVTFAEHVHSAESDDDVPLDIVKHELQEDNMCPTSVSSRNDEALAATSRTLSNGEQMTSPDDKPFYFQCRACKKSFYELRRLNSHFCAFADKKPHQCQVCQKRFIGKNYLLRHARVHSSERPFECNVCDKKFRLKSNLTSHVKRHNEKPHQCRVCQKRFFSNSHLLNHLLVHESERPFECDVCHKTFKSKSNLRAHVAQHQVGGQGRFQCGECNKRFNYSGNLKKHAQLHSGERPHHCHCGKRFVTRSALVKHERTHTRSGAKPYRCERCHETFNYNSNLLKHQRCSCRLSRTQ